MRRSRLICTSTARSLTVAAVAGKRQRGTVSPGVAAKQAQHLALAVGQMDDLVALAQFAAREMKDEGPEAHRLDRLAPPPAARA